MALMLRCYAVGSELVRLVGRLPVGMSALSDTAALGDRGMSVLLRCCSARELACARGRWCNGADAMVLRGRRWTGTARGPVAGRHGRPERHCSAR